jgi:hypothetical protein
MCTENTVDYVHRQRSRLCAQTAGSTVVAMMFVPVRQSFQPQTPERSLINVRLLCKTICEERLDEFYNSVHLSVRLPPDGISWNFVFGILAKICRHKLLLETNTLHEDLCVAVLQSVFLTVTDCASWGRTDRLCNKQTHSVLGPRLRQAVSRQPLTAEAWVRSSPVCVRFVA